MTPPCSGPWKTLLVSLAAQNGSTKEEAAKQLSNAWEITNEAEIELWDKELEEQERVNKEARLQAEVDDLKKAEEAQWEAKWEKKETERKKPWLPDFDSNMCPPDFLCDRASQYARKKLEIFEYVKLWYFMPEGCADCKGNLTIKHDVQILAMGIQSISDKYNTAELAKGDPKRKL